MGAALFMVERDYNLSESVVYGFGSRTGWRSQSFCAGRDSFEKPSKLHDGPDRLARSGYHVYHVV